MTEWSKVMVLKTIDPHGSGGSNPSLSAIPPPSEVRLSCAVGVSEDRPHGDPC
jgi:hypothetical protein